MPTFAVDHRSRLTGLDFSFFASPGLGEERLHLAWPTNDANHRQALPPDGIDFSGSVKNFLASVVSSVATRPDPSGHDTMVATTASTSLFIDGGPGDAGAIDANDVFQGGMGDCYLLAAMANVAKHDPDAIRDLVRVNRDADGNVVSYTVALWSKDGNGRLMKSPQTVDAKEFSQNASGYGDTDAAGNREIWPRILEKAYAQLKGGHSAIGYGGGANDAIEALTGQRATMNSPERYSFDQLEADISGKKPVCFLTPDTKDASGKVINGKKEKLLGGHGMFGDHYYYATETRVKDGQQQVRLMNPWGTNHPGADKDGWVPFHELMKNGEIERVDVGASMGRTARLLRDIVGQIARAA